MARQILIGFIAEGPTDIRFLSSVIRRTFEKIALNCHETIEILDVIPLKTETGTFVQKVMKAAQLGQKVHGISVLCVHSDADAPSDATVMQHKFKPAMDAISNMENEAYRNIVPVVPVQMIEAWMLADMELLKEQIGTNMSNHDLGLNRAPESITDPKFVIDETIRLARASLPKRWRWELKRTELYQPIGSAIELDKLASLPSYRKFCDSVRLAFSEMNIH